MLDKEHLLVFRSFLEIASVKMEAEELEVAVETIFRETGVENKSGLTLEDFQYVMLKDHRESFEQAQLSLPGNHDLASFLPENWAFLKNLSVWSSLKMVVQTSEYFHLLKY